MLYTNSCPNCGANIQLPADSIIAKCMYCGTSLVAEDTIERFKLEQSGIEPNNLDYMNKNAEGFLVLGKWLEAMNLYKRITEMDPIDFRGWWGLFLVKTKNMTEVNDIDAYIDTSDAETAIRLASDIKKAELIGLYNQYQQKNPKVYVLSITRARLLGGSSEPWKVVINNRKFINLNVGETIPLGVPEGIYTLEIDVPLRPRCITKFEMHGDAHVSYRIGFWSLVANVEGANVQIM